MLAYGVDRVTLAEIARRARVSRPTIYRRWPDTRVGAGGAADLADRRRARRRAQRGVGREALVERIVGVAERLRRDDVVMSVLHSAPELAMVYIAERLGTSQQILIDARGRRDQGRPGRRQRSRRRSAPARRDVPADHPVDDPVGADRRADPRRRRTRRRTRPLTERIPEAMTNSTALNASRRAAELAALADGAHARRRRHRRRHHRHRHRVGRRDARAVGGAGGEARPGVRHQPVELQAGARRSALSGDRQRRHRPAQRRRARNPDDAQRTSPGQRDAATGSAAARR